MSWRTRLSTVVRAVGSLRKPRETVRGKLMLVVMLSTMSALLIAGAGLLLTEIQNNREAWSQDVSTEAGILALATAPALSFADRQTAVRNLAALDARPSIRAAALYLPNGDLYAHYARPGEIAPAIKLPKLPPGIRIRGDRVELIRPIMQNQEVLGTLYLRAQYDLNERLRAYAGVLASVLLGSLIAALLLTGWLQRVITDPLDAMTRVAQGVVGQRDYSLRVSKTTNDEIGLVVDAFNNMLQEVQLRTRALEESEKLYRAIGESIQYGVWICDAQGRCTYASDSFLRLTGLTQAQCAAFGWVRKLHAEDQESSVKAWQECVRTGADWYREFRILGVDGLYHPILAQGVAILDDKNEITGWAGIHLDISPLKRTEQALREADRRKDEFLATLAHELRNPLAPIRNAVKILGLSNADDRHRRWGREVIARQVQNMALLLDDLLDVSRITRGKLELKKDFVELQAIVELAIETARPLIEARRHHLNTRLPPQPLILEADLLRLSQILSNLLTNAAKYTDAGGEITLIVTQEDGQLIMSVADNGIGLSKESIPKLFAMFSQVQTAEDRAEGGLGIGLGLVKGLVQLHGGSIEARSAGLGRGSEFIVYLPESIIAQEPREIREERGSAVASDAKQASILVADDNRDGAESLSLMLELSGYKVLRAFSGTEAFDLAAKNRPDALILDIGMPGLTGYEVAHRVRLEAWGKSVVLIALTGWGQEDDKRKAQAAGFDEHLTKPIDPSTLDATLARLLVIHSHPKALERTVPEAG